jgi:hypothetical protein
VPRASTATCQRGPGVVWWAPLAVGVLVAGVVAWVVTAPDTVPTADRTPHQIEAHFGMGSPYHHHFGVYADGISLTEVSLPLGWEGRVRTEQIADGPDANNPVTLRFPEIHDLCASKLTVAVTGGFGRRSDREFVAALIEAGLVDTELLIERIEQLPDTVAIQIRHAARNIVQRLRRGPSSE